ncbi:hypothetical protein KIPB_001540 [Kipferlia bialata]|uniref:Kelch-type beta propeller n=1 Tax=Kipferlia bialata TaxID=797122 RepID=A0A9K3CQ66_9EUKA|nr:hypothetical protein KIPB_001540 [Kipferlia bialata]|eukprot:g1540.t1
MPRTLSLSDFGGSTRGFMYLHSLGLDHTDDIAKSTSSGTVVVNGLQKLLVTDKPMKGNKGTQSKSEYKLVPGKRQFNNEAVPGGVTLRSGVYFRRRGTSHHFEVFHPHSGLWKPCRPKTGPKAAKGVRLHGLKGKILRTCADEAAGVWEFDTKTEQWTRLPEAPPRPEGLEDATRSDPIILGDSLVYIYSAPGTPTYTLSYTDVKGGEGEREREWRWSAEWGLPPAFSHTAYVNVGPKRRYALFLGYTADNTTLGIGCIDAETERFLHLADTDFHVHKAVQLSADTCLALCESPDAHDGKDWCDMTLDLEMLSEAGAVLTPDIFEGMGVA